MSKILIDLNELGSDNKIAIQGIKIFLAKNKDAIVTIIAEQDNVLTIKDHKRVNIYSLSAFKDKIDKKYDSIKTRSLALSMQLLNNEEESLDAFTTYSNKVEVARACKEYLHQVEESPLIIATFANYKTHRVTCIGDLGFKENPTTKDYINYLSLMSRYMQKAFKKENIEFKLLTYSKYEKNPLVDVFKDKTGYKGELEGKDLLKADTDVIIGNPYEFLGIISGIDHGISIYDEFIKDYTKKSVGIRLFSYPMFKSVFTAFHMEIDQKLTSGGNILLGYSKNVVIIDKDTIKQGVNVSLNLANKLETL